MGDGSTDRLARLAAQLGSMGAETPTERNVKRVLPWVLSLVLHILIFAVAALITWTVTSQSKSEDAVLIVADFNALTYEPVAATAHAEPLTTPAPTTPTITSPLPTIDEVMREVASPSIDLSAVLPSNAAVAERAISGLSPTNEQHAVSFAGTSATNAKRIVYAIDATGTMIAHFQIVIDELARSLSNLTSEQRFAIVFFQGDQAIEVPPTGRLNPATPAAREQALQWIRQNIVPREGTNPIVALEKCLRLKPDVVFLLSHGITGYGKYEVDQRDLLGKLDSLNPIVPQTGRRSIQINCIQFMDRDPLDTMRLIANEHGGPNGYKFLSRSELGLNDR